jgi:hypothetical protein
LEAGARWHGEVIVTDAPAALWLDVHQDAPAGRQGFVVMGPKRPGPSPFPDAYPYPGGA